VAKRIKNWQAPENKIGKDAKVKVVILGAGGLARETLWVFKDIIKENGNNMAIMGFIDENPANRGKNLCGVPVLGDFHWFESVRAKSEIKAICAVGSPQVKKSFAEKAARTGLGFLTLVHPSVQSSEFIEIGTGTVITAGCILTTQIKIGNHVYLNLDTTVGHDVIIEDFVNVAPGCHISGNVVLKEGADLGTGAVILQGITVGSWSVIGAGAVVTEDIPDNTLAAGVPAKVIRKLTPEAGQP
jgi:sugar O-acyltransferase (sialic acid O-acetyltransferase NeuD family)